MEEESKDEQIVKDREYIENNVFPYENLNISRTVVSNIEEYLFGHDPTF